MSRLTPEQFISLWQESNGVEEVCEKSGMNYGAVSTRAWLYRKRGIPLKKFKEHSTDWESMKSLAEKTKVSE